MKTMQPVLTTSIQATADILKHRFIGFNGNYASADSRALGVSGADTKAGQYIPVVAVGIALVEASGAISAGAAVAVAANGKAQAATAFSVSVPSGVTAVTSDAAQPNLIEAGGVLPQAVMGYALDSASADGDIIRILLC